MEGKQMQSCTLQKTKSKHVRNVSLYLSPVSTLVHKRSMVISPSNYDSPNPDSAVLPGVPTKVLISQTGNASDGEVTRGMDRILITVSCNKW